MSPKKLPRARRSSSSLPPVRARGNLFPIAAKRALAIDGEIGRSVTSAKIREAITSMGDGDFGITINSIGGSVTEGIAIYHAIRNARGKKTATVEGIAASMASLILQAADVRRVASGSFVMIHNPSAPNDGEAADHEKTAETLRKIEAEMLDIYTARSGGDREEIRKLMDAETYMTAEEAVELGFADEIADDVSASIKLDAVAKLNQDKLPAALASLKGKKTMDEEEMKARIAALEEENARLKAKAEEDEDEEPKDEGESEEEEEKEEAKALLDVVRRVTGKRKIAEMRGALMALGAKVKLGEAGDRKARVDALVASGKLAPVDREWAMSETEVAFSAYERAMGKTQVVPVGKEHKAPTGSGASPDELTEAEKALQKASGLKPEAIIAARKASPMGVEKVN